jgi:type IV fimbrial biogenesis protein FimT
MISLNHNYREKDGKISKPSVCIFMPFVLQSIAHNKPFVCIYSPLVCEIRRESGFTVVELMVTLIIAAILVSLAVPNMRMFIQNARLSSQTNDLIADLNVTRSEAIKRGVPVTLCRSASPEAATPVCGSGANWENGWVVFADTNGNRSYNAADNDTVIRTHPALAGNNTLRINLVDMADSLSYLASGLIFPAPSPGTQATFTFCDDRGATAARGVVIENTGRAAAVRNTAGTLSCP